jgi:hypothetical protein
MESNMLAHASGTAAKSALEQAINEMESENDLEHRAEEAVQFYTEAKKYA